MAKKSPTKKPKASPKTQSSIKIDGEVWPLERDVLFRPDRMKYVRRLIPTSGCVFCNAEENEVSFETLCVFKTKHSMLMLNKFPYNSGHILVLPRKHCGDVLNLSEAQYLDLMNLVREGMKALTQIYNPGGINLGLNHGAVAGAGIPEHLHYHIIPRWTGDMNFFPIIAETKVMVESLDQTYANLSKYFNSKKGKKK